MEENKKGTFRILLVGLPGVGKRTIVNRFKEGYSDFNKRVKSAANLSNEDELLHNKLKGRGIELNTLDILNDQQQHLEYSSKNDLYNYDIVALVFDLGDKDGIQKVAEAFSKSQLNFADVKSRCLKALWGNKKDLFKFTGDRDEFIAQLYLKLKQQYKLLSYVKSSSGVSQIKKKSNNDLPPVETNDPFKCVAILMDDYFDQVLTEKSPSYDILANSGNSNSRTDSQETYNTKNHMKYRALNEKQKMNIRSDCATSFQDKREKPFPSIGAAKAEKQKVSSLDSCQIF